MRILPTTSADCERGFSLLRRFKNELCSKLKTAFVSDMMSVKLNTSPFKYSDTVPFVESWFLKKARRVAYTRGQVPTNNEIETFVPDMEDLTEPVDAVC